MQTDIAPPPVTLERVTSESAPTLQNLFQLYAHDFSEHTPLEIEPNGRFGVAVDEAWWTRADHFAFLIRMHGKLAGFAWARPGSRVTSAAHVMDVAEFFVLRGLRARGVGRSAAHALFNAFPGAWEVRIRRSNAAALQFWRKAAESWQGVPVPSREFTSHGVVWDVLCLERQG